jgi:hypothetical protein
MNKYMKFPKPIKKVKVKKIKKSTLKNRADKLFSLYIRKIGICQLRGKDGIRCGGNLQCMHITTRGKTALRYEPLNALCGCAGHHVFYTYHPDDWADFMRKNYPAQWNYVQNHKVDTVKKTEDLYKEVIEKYKEQL